MAHHWRGTDRIARVAVVGTGVIGSGWATAFLAHGLSVSVFDPAPDAEQRLRAYVVRAGGDPAGLSFHADLAACLDGADFVQESTPERVEMKATLFAQLDGLLPPDVIVASSTSSLPITELAADCPTGERFVLGHPYNPVHLMPLVEVGGGERTDRAAIDTAQAFYVALGKQPVRLEREIFGHVANRMTSAMLREAISLVANGIATVEDVDKAIRFGPAMKWAIQGPFTTSHTSGGDAGLAGFLEHFAPGIMKRWSTMSDPDLASPELRKKLVSQMEKAAGGRSVADIAANQDKKLVALLDVLNKPAP